MKCPLVRLAGRPLPPGWTGYVLGDVEMMAEGAEPLVVCAPLDGGGADGVEVAAADFSAPSLLVAQVRAVDAAWCRWQRQGDPEDVPLPPGWTLTRGLCDCGGPLWTARHVGGRESRSDRLGEVVRMAWTDHDERSLFVRVVGVCLAFTAAAALLAFGVLVARHVAQLLEGVR